MKALPIAALIIAAASFSASAQDAAQDVADPTSLCTESIVEDARLAVIADKITLDFGAAPGQAALQRYATAEERAALAVWHGMRKHCFDAGEQYRRIVFSAQSRAVLQSAFVFQQVLLSELQQGRVTYGEFNRRRGEQAASLDPRI